MYKKYKTVIGLEVHVELATKSKLFCACSTNFGAEPNANTCPICMGLPGAKPKLNRKVLEYAVAACVATHCEIASVIAFDRKNYFYPDSPHDYQITQFYHPIGVNGYLDLPEGRIHIHEMHMEEDAGKLIHSQDGNETYVDYNRAGVPLLEIVTEPDFRSAEQVVQFLEKLRLNFLYLGISDCKLQEGSMRVDVNLSVREVGDPQLGTRTEMKNLGSFRSVRRAIEKETLRHINILEQGQVVNKETRRWDEAEDTSYAMRPKEDSSEYRYFPEAEVPAVQLNERFLRSVKEMMPPLPEEKKERYVGAYGLSEYDADIVLQSKGMSDFFEAVVEAGGHPKTTANWLMVELLRLWNLEGCGEQEVRIPPADMVALLSMVEQKRINAGVAKQVFEAMYHKGVHPEEFVLSEGLLMQTDKAEMEQMVAKVLQENPQALRDFRAGKDRAFGFLVGQSMKALQGKADPVAIKEILTKQLQEFTA